MFYEVRFRPENELYRSYVLVCWPNRPNWPRWASFRELERESTLRVLLSAVCTRVGHANWQLLRFMGIDEHPSNLSRQELAQLIRSRVEGQQRLALFEESWESLRQAERTSRESEAPPRTREPPLFDFIGIELVDDEGTAIPDVRLELQLSTGDGQSVVTDAGGRVVRERVPQGQCRLRLLTR